MKKPQDPVRSVAIGYALPEEKVAQYVLEGLQREHQELNRRIVELQRRLKFATVTQRAPKAHKQHRISPEGLKRIREAQRRRWAAVKAAKA